MALLILGLVLFLGTHAFSMAREPRAWARRAPRRGTVQGPVLAPLDRRRGPDRHRLRPLSGGRIHPGLGAAGLDAPLGASPGLARLRDVRRTLFPRPDQAHPQAPDARRREAVGPRPPSRQRRSRLDPPLRLDPRLGGHGADLGEAPRRGPRSWWPCNVSGRAEERPDRGRDRDGRVARLPSAPACLADRGSGAPGRRRLTLAIPERL